MNDAEDIRQLLRDCRTIAIVGLSQKSERPSHEVAQYLQQHGYRIVPVNPSYSGSQILDEPCYASLADAAAALQRAGTKIDIVDCFRQSAAIDAIADDAIQIGAKCLWLQLGVTNPAASAKAQAAGLAVIEDRCIKIEHRTLGV